MKKITAFILASMLLFSGCGQSVSSVPEESSDPFSSGQGSAVSEGVRTSSEVSEAEVSSEVSTVVEEIGGGLSVCQEHTFSYHSIPLALIRLVGQDSFNQWLQDNAEGRDEYGRNDETFCTIAVFVRDFDIDEDIFREIVGEEVSNGASAMGISEETYRQEYGFTEEQISAIFGDDPAELNRVFCGPLAIYNEDDGELYPIYWLAEHTADDYLAAGLSLDEVAEVLERAGEDVYAADSRIVAMAESAESTLTEALALEEAAEAAASAE